MDEIRTILAGGSPLLQAGIVAALALDARLKLVAQVQDGRQEATCALQVPCDVLILNAEVPHVEAAPVIEHLTNGAAQTRLLVLTDDESQEEMLAALRLGVHGYGIRKFLQTEDFCAGVRALARWGSWACPLTTRWLMALASQQTAALWARADRSALLSERELEVLQMAARGVKEELIASTLCLSRNTVKTYLRRIREKLQAASRAEAVALALERGLLPGYPPLRLQAASRAEPVRLAS